MLKTLVIAISEDVAYLKHDGVWWENNGHGVCTFSVPDCGWNDRENRPRTVMEADALLRRDIEDSKRFHNNAMNFIVARKTTIRQCGHSPAFAAAPSPQSDTAHQ